MPLTTSFFVPVLMPGQTADAYTVGYAVTFTTLPTAGGGGGPTPPYEGQLWPRGNP